MTIVSSACGPSPSSTATTFLTAASRRLTVISPCKRQPASSRLWGVGPLSRAVIYVAFQVGQIGIERGLEHLVEHAAAAMQDGNSRASRRRRRRW